SAGGDQVHVLAGQATSVTRGSAPRPARAATAPSTVVKVTMDRTQNAVVTDANGRSVGVQNGTPLRYVPGSTVEVVDGQLVITIPNAPAGLLGTLVRTDPPSPGGQGPGSIAIRTQII